MLGTRCPKLDTTSRSHKPRGALGRRGTQCALLEAGKVLGTRCPKLDKVLGDRCSKLDTTSRNQNGLSAQGRRVREADPDSRSASERGESAKREKPREQGRRHLVVNSQVSDKAARRAQARAASSARHFRVPFLPHRANRVPYPPEARAVAS